MALFQYLGPRNTLFDGKGNLMPGANVFIYEPGTTTKITTYKDSALSVANSNPVILNGSGRASVWFSANADIRIEDKDGNLIDTDLNVNRSVLLPPVAFGTYNFDTDTLSNSSGCGLVRLAEGLGTLTLTNPLSGIANAIILTNKEKYEINFTTTTTAIVTAQLGVDTTILGTIANGTTTDVIAHSLGSQVSINQIQVTAKETLGSAKELHVQAATSTNFTIGCDTDPGKDVDFTAKISSSIFSFDPTSFEFVIYDGGA